jgi:hypothetical protein
VPWKNKVIKSIRDNGQIADTASTMSVHKQKSTSRLSMIIVAQVMHDGALMAVIVQKELLTSRL